MTIHKTWEEMQDNKLIKILKSVGTDDVVFPEYEIKMVRNVNEKW